MHRSSSRTACATRRATSPCSARASSASRSCSARRRRRWNPGPTRRAAATGCSPCASGRTGTPHCPRSTCSTPAKWCSRRASASRCWRRSANAWRAASRASSSSTAAAMRRCSPAWPAAGSRAARAARQTSCCTWLTAACAAITAALSGAFRKPARPAATRISTRSGAVPSAWKRGCRSAFPLPGSSVSTATR